MHSFKERFNKTMEFVGDPDVGIIEGAAHIYYWFRFERAIERYHSAKDDAEKFGKKLSTSLEVVKFRKEMKIDQL